MTFIKGQAPWNKGKHHSDETRRKISDAIKISHSSLATRKKMSDSHKGKPGNFGKNKHEVEMFKKQWGENAIFGEFKNWGGVMHDKIEKTGERVPCVSLLNSLTILWDGRVVPCCLDYDGKLILGDANKQSLGEIWHQTAWLRDKHRKLDFSMEPCKNCNQNI